MKRGRVWSLVLVLVMGLLGMALGPVWAGGAGDPDPGTVVGIKTLEFADGTVGITTTAYFASSTGEDTRYWQSADVFVTADIEDTNTITITPQWSADGTNWVNAKYQSEGWYTATRSSEWVTYQLILSADGTDVVAIPLLGNYLRLTAETLTTTFGITPTISVVLRNDGGR